jgi:hypothetical protein
MIKYTELNYEKDIRIDEDQLDIEWIEQPELALRYAKQLSSIRAMVNQLEEEKKTVRSELIVQANNDPEGCTGKAKPNAGDLEAYYRTHARYKEVIEDLLKVQEELEYAQLAFQEISWTRKNALENLVKLHAQEYFAGPSMPRDIAAKRKAFNEKKEQKTNSGISDKMKRKRTPKN